MQIVSLKELKMKQSIKINFLKSAVYGYALMEEITEENKTEEWAKQIQSIKRYFERIKPKGLIKKDIKPLMELQEKLKNLDMDFFEDKLFSPYVVCMLILNYLMTEKRDLELRNRFLHLDIDVAINAIEEKFRANGVNKSHNDYFIKVLELIGE